MTTSEVKYRRLYKAYKLWEKSMYAGLVLFLGFGIAAVGCREDER